MLHSSSGFAMPFEEERDTVPSLDYGEQRHPVTGENFFHHGVDFAVRHMLLKAVATGTVSSVGMDPVLGITQTIRYGGYEVTYGHLSNIMANFGQQVRAGQTVSISGDMLHLAVRFRDEELNPLEFLTMLYANVAAAREHMVPQEDDFEFEQTRDLRIDYSQNRELIDGLMEQYLHSFMTDISRSLYSPRDHFLAALRNALYMASERYFDEHIPSAAHPFGLGRRAAPAVNKVESVFIDEFLTYLSQRKGIVVPGYEPAAAAGSPF